MRKNESPDLRKLVLLALLCALFIVLERFLSFNVWNMRIGFAFVPLALSGILFGPLPAAAVGAVGDILGMMLVPTGPYFPGFTLNAALTGAVFGLFLHKKQTKALIAGAVSINQLLLSLFLQTLWISVTYGSPYAALLPVRLTQCLIMIPLQFIVLLLVAKPLTIAAKRMELSA
ncbi:MAG: folate family ECF transporter S component [Lachnospiraceae bacterium]|nr:folate family ECF transporter S component [Lachnospiraceae bacterium]